MPFAPYRNVLSPYDLAAAQEAFDQAWIVIAAEDSYDMDLARQLLAKLIMQAIQENGERDPERLKVYALAGFKQ